MIRVTAGLVYAAFGVVMIWKRAWFAQRTVESRRRLARAVPWMVRYRYETDERFWRVAMVPVGALFLVGGIVVATVAR